MSTQLARIPADAAELPVPAGAVGGAELVAFDVLEPDGGEGEFV